MRILEAGPAFYRAPECALLSRGSSFCARGRLAMNPEAARLAPSEASNNSRGDSEKSFHEDAERVGAVTGKGSAAFEANALVERQSCVTNRPRLQAKHSDPFAACLRDQSIENPASYSSTSRSLLNPHAFNFSPVVV